MHYSTNNSNNTNNSSNNFIPSFTLVRSLLIILSLSLVQLFLLSLPLCSEAVTVKSRFVHNKRRCRIKCRCQQRGTCWWSDWHWICTSSQARPIHRTYTDSNGAGLWTADWGACSSLPSWLTLATTVLFGQSIPLKLVKATLIWIQSLIASMSNCCSLQ